MREQISEEEGQALQAKYGLIKCNIPSTFKDYQNGNGEGIWAVPADLETCQGIKDDTATGQGYVIAANDSTYYPGEIVCGSKVLIEFRGSERPIAVWDDLQGTKEAVDNKKKILERLTKE